MLKKYFSYVVFVFFLFSANLAFAADLFNPSVDYTAGSYPMSIASSDLNGDGKVDLAVVNDGSGGESVSIFINNGDGTFAPSVDYALSPGSSPDSVAIGDLNGDGKPDLAVVNQSSATVSVFVNNGNGTFTPGADYPTGTTPFSVAIGDLNGDGKSDLVVANFESTSNSVSVLINNGAGTFAPKVDYSVGSYPTSVVIGDLNGDSKLDLAVANDGSESVSVLMNNGDGTFAPKVDYAAGVYSYSVVMGDLNKDGKLDLAVANYGGSASVLMNNGDGTFAPKVDYITGNSPASISIGDIDGNGYNDFVTANFGGGSISVFLNNGNGTFPERGEDYTTGAYPYSVTLDDLNGDSRLDLATANIYSNSMSILLATNGDADGDGILGGIENLLTGSNSGLTVNTQGISGALTVTLNPDSSIDFSGTSTDFPGITFSVELPAGSTVPSGVMTVDSLKTAGNRQALIFSGIVMPSGATKTVEMKSSPKVCIIDNPTAGIDIIGTIGQNCTDSVADYRTKMDCPGTKSATFADGPRNYSCTINGSSMNITGLKHTIISNFVDSDNDGVDDVVDVCPTSVGLPENQGCPVVKVETKATLHKVDLGGASSKGSITGSEVRVFDRNNSNFQLIAGSSNPDGSLYGIIYEAGAGKVGSCTTNNEGACDASVYEHLSSNYLVILRYLDPITKKSVYVGRPGNGNKELQIIKVFKKGVFVEYRGGSKIVVSGSFLEMIVPTSAVWEGTQSIYPFIFSSDSDWDLDVCANVPQGYTILGIYDNAGNLAPTKECTQLFVANEIKVMAFEVKDVGSPEPSMDVTISANHNKKITKNSFKISDLRKDTFKKELTKAQQKVKEIKGGVEKSKVPADSLSLMEEIIKKVRSLLSLISITI